MSFKRYKPITPGTRHRKIVSRKNLAKKELLKVFASRLTKHSGHNNTGQITVLHRGGGHKKKYKIIDFKRQLYKENAKIIQLEYDSNRTGMLALIYYPKSKLFSYILSPQNLTNNKDIKSTFNILLNDFNIEKNVNVGNCLPLFLIPNGSLIHNIELKPGAGGQLVKAAGTSGQLIEKYKNGYASILLPSNKIRLISLYSLATIGEVSNQNHKHIVYGKAGIKSWLNKRPRVRGVAMNPIDHPHGGGEGKSKSGRPSVSKWGYHTKGRKTRNKKRTNIYILKNTFKK